VRRHIEPTRQSRDGFAVHLVTLRIAETARTIKYDAHRLLLERGTALAAVRATVIPPDRSPEKALVPPERIDRRIVRLRGRTVLLDFDLAGLYGVTTRELVQAVKRNRSRFPPDFMFQLPVREVAILRSQIVISSSWGGRRTAPYAFTEQGVAMLSSVLRSERAVKANIEIMRAFVRLRRMLDSHADLARKIEALEAKYDSQFSAVFQAIRELMAAPAPLRKRIGFRG
jgi:hypothetical protein